MFPRSFSDLLCSRLSLSSKRQRSGAEWQLCLPVFDGVCMGGGFTLFLTSEFKGVCIINGTSSSVLFLPLYIGVNLLE